MDTGRVISAVDFSESSRRALDYAIAVAKWYGSCLTVLHVRTAAAPVVAPFPVLAPSAIESLIVSADDREQWRWQLEAFVPVHAARGVRIEFSIGEGDVAAEVLAQAQSSDMIVIGTHGRSGLEHLVLGSVAEKVLRGAPCPLLTIPRRAAEATAAVPGLFHHIVAAVDFSEASMHALAYALSLAEEADARLTLLHVVDIPEQPELWVDRRDRASVVLELQERRGSVWRRSCRMQPAHIATSRCVSKTASRSARSCGWRPTVAPVSSSLAPTVAAWSSGCSWDRPHSRSSARQRSRC